MQSLLYCRVGWYAVTRWTRILRVLCSNFYRDRGYPKAFRGFTQPLKENSGIVPGLDTVHFIGRFGISAVYSPFAETRESS
jgi:hypothetical protein